MMLDILFVMGKSGWWTEVIDLSRVHLVCKNILRNNIINGILEKLFYIINEGFIYLDTIILYK